MGQMGQILIGISSWADPSLAKSGAFYPENVTTSPERLRYYTRHFPITELDSSFYSLPSRNNLKLWVENTPDGFLFNVKAFRLLTNHPTPYLALPRSIRNKVPDSKKQDNLYLRHLSVDVIEELWQGFNLSLQPLHQAKRIGVVFFQFPPWFVARPENLAYIADCRERLAKDYRMAVEFRAGNWFNEKLREETLVFLRQYGISLICVDEPQGFKSSVPPIVDVTTSPGIVRFHGRNKEHWEKKGVSDERFVYLYSENELKEWVLLIENMAAKAAEVYVIFKNKYRDYPVNNALQMKLLLGLK